MVFAANEQVAVKLEAVFIKYYDVKFINLQRGKMFEGVVGEAEFQWLQELNINGDIQILDWDIVDNFVDKKNFGG